MGLTGAEATRSLDDNLDELIASNPAVMPHAADTWRQARETAAVYRRGPRVLFLSHAETRAAFRDSRVFSNRGHYEGSQAEAVRARLTDAQLGVYHEIAAFEANFVSRSDGEAHTRLRNIGKRAFTPRRIAMLADAVERYTDELLHDVGGADGVDVVSRFSYVLPLKVIADLLGVSHADRELIHDWSSRLGRNRGGTDPVALMDAHAAMREFRAYIDEVIAAKRGAEPESDLVAALMDARQGDRLTADELAAMFVVLLFAGHETTTNLISVGLFELHRHPDQWRALCADPGLAHAGVEELLRFGSPIQYVFRLATEPVAVSGVDIEAGETVFLVIASANRDPAVFAQPDRLDLTRRNAKEHLSFGFGPHFCLGNALARLEGEIALATFARRFPDMDVATDEATWGGNTMQRAITGLPVQFGPERR